jgi:hypothetical protein
MICLECAETDPRFKLPPHPVPLEKTLCPVCRKERLCIENSVVGVPQMFMTLEEGFQFLAKQMAKGKLP